MARDPLQDVMAERARQDAKWGEQNHKDLYWLGILSEEVGELARNLIDPQTPLLERKAREELVQVAAVAVAWLECMERRRMDEARRAGP